MRTINPLSCISFFSYIKPQRWIIFFGWTVRCISFFSYIKPQLSILRTEDNPVVYRSFPTSNHNGRDEEYRKIELYIVLFLHQTTTQVCQSFRFQELYIVLFLHQTTTQDYGSWFLVWLYIVLFLHQTTTAIILLALVFWLYIVLFLHQTTTCDSVRLFWLGCISFFSYIKPQHDNNWLRSMFCCISFFSYIKPQLWTEREIDIPVVYRSFPTSNHNYCLLLSRCCWVVYRSFPTSNHNGSYILTPSSLLYIVLFLHQTTTMTILLIRLCRCISFFSYIKPQLWKNLQKKLLSCISFFSYIKPQQRQNWSLSDAVVYRSFPTSNHNFMKMISSLNVLYIVLFLHQTTTFHTDILCCKSCISFFSYIKPQPYRIELPACHCCISFFSYIKPQHVFHR